MKLYSIRSAQECLVSTADDDLIAMISRHGWAVIKIAAEDHSPPFAYSIGLYRTFHHPEIIVLGLPPDTAHQLVNDVGETVRQGEVVRAGQASAAFLEGYTCTFRRVPPSQYPAYLGRGLHYYAPEAFPVLQLIYPDRQGRWPWQEGVAPEFRSNQPVLADEPPPPWGRKASGLTSAEAV